MADPTSYRPATGTIPTDPGVYRFFDSADRVIYVGKAKNLRSRLMSYFADPSTLHFRTKAMVFTAERVDWTLVSNEVEALTLEYTWIKEFDPRFNVRFRDDKSYPYLAVTTSEEIPRAMVMRGAHRQKDRYFGPYAHAWAIRETLDLLLRVFPIRTCSAGVFRRAKASNRPCLLGYIDRCSAPCVGRVSAEEHRELVDEFCAFMSGRTKPITDALVAKMAQASSVQDYEAAARYRDDLEAIAKATERNAIALADATNADAFAVADDDLEVAAQIFVVREGRVRGQHSRICDKTADLDDADVLATVIQQFYGPISGDDIPGSVLVSRTPSDHHALTEWLSSKRGRHVKIQVAQRGEKRALLETVRQNAEHTLAQHKLSRTSSLADRTRALVDLEQALDLPESPLRIECIDISHHQGEAAFGSAVVFEDGMPSPKQYRSYSVSEENAGNDVGSIAEVVTRRYQAKDERQRYAPHLIVIDGGMPQVQAAASALASVGESIPIIGLAKRLEEIVTSDGEIIVLPRGSEGLYLLQRVRDEAHRFAIKHHRNRASKRVRGSELDAIPGVGPSRRAALLKRFGSVKNVRAASVEEIAAVVGIGPVLAVTIQKALGEVSALDENSTA